MRYAQKFARLAMVAAMFTLTLPVWSGSTAWAQTTQMTQFQQADAPAIPVAQPTVEVSGQGQQTSRKFTLEAGLVTYHAQHSGKSNFIVYILDGTTGQEVTSIVNEIGAVDATKALQMRKGGTYVARVEADGPWSLSFEQPRPTEAPAAPQAYSGNGTSLSPFFHSDGGLLMVAGSYQGDGRVAIRLRDINGVVVDQVANQVGSFNGSLGMSVPAGIYFLEMYGNGTWSVTVE